MNKLWLSKKRVHIKKKIKLYKALVKPVLTYNAGTWGLRKDEISKLNSFHRKQLRKIWKNPRMRNRKVYKDSEETEIYEEVTRSRWRILGHCLRLPEDTPAQKAMEFYFKTDKNDKKFSGRQRTTIATTINNEIKEANTKIINFPIDKLETNDDLRKL